MRTDRERSARPARCARAAIVPLVVIWLCRCAPAGTPAPEAVAGEIERLRGLVATASYEADSWPRVKSGVSRRLTELSEDVEQGRLLLALHGLSGVRNTLLAYVFHQDRTQDAEADLELFDSAWSEVELELSLGPASLPDRLPAAVRGMAEASWLRTRPYHRASRGFAATADPKDGLFYLGRAKAHADFVKFAGTLDFGKLGAAPPVRSLARELDELESRVLALYVPPRSVERRGAFIGLNATLKLARELNDERAYSGALYKYLEAVLRLGEIEIEAPDEATAAQHRARATELSEQLSASDRDDSLARLFLEMALAAFPSADGALPNRSELIRAGSVVERVLPAYLEVLASAPAERPRSDAAVTVTLVRWPYT